VYSLINSGTIYIAIEAVFAPTRTTRRYQPAIGGAFCDLRKRGACLVREMAARATNVWLERQASDASNASSDHGDADLRCTNTVPSLPVTMLLMSKAVKETTITHSFRMAYSRINMLSIAMSVLASHMNHTNTISFHQLIQSMETIDDLVRQIDKRESLLKMTHLELIGALRTCPFVRFRENCTNLNMSEVSLVEISSLNQYEMDRWAKQCDATLKCNDNALYSGM